MNHTKAFINENNARNHLIEKIEQVITCKIVTKVISKLHNLQRLFAWDN